MRTLLEALSAHANGSRQLEAPVSVAPEGAPTVDLLRLLYREDRKAEEGRFGSTLIHASSLVHMPSCARMLFLG